MLNYLAVAFRHPTGSWAAVMPDFVGVTGRGSDPLAAIQEAKAGAQTILRALKGVEASIPTPMDIGTAQRNPILAKDYGVDWSSAVVRLVAIESDGSSWIDRMTPDVTPDGRRGGIVASAPSVQQPLKRGNGRPTTFRTRRHDPDSGRRHLATSLGPERT